MSKGVTVHASSSIGWHKRFSAALKEGLKKHSIECSLTSSTKRKSDVAIILGPNLYKNIENDGGEYMILNRKFLGFGPRDALDNVAISWNGFNGMGIFNIPTGDIPNRLSKYLKDEEILDWDLNHEKYLLCRQYDTGRSTRHSNINTWYKEIQSKIDSRNLKIRDKITPERAGHEKFLKSLKEDIKDVKAIFSLNSIVSVEAIVLGKGVITEDITNPCYSVSSKDRLEEFDRYNFLNYLANCQWNINEISSGEFLDRMGLEAFGPRLHEI